MTDLLHRDGFFGTAGNFAADMTLVIMLLGASIFTYGAWVMIKHDDYNRHKMIQTVGAVVNLIMVLWMMVLPFRDFVVADKGGPRIPIFYQVTALHAIFGTVAVLFGWFVVLRGHGLMIEPLRFTNWKLFMRIAYGLYMIATILGIIVYIIWFVVVPNPPVF
ncbi:MAG: hypothetical protein ACPG8W_18570 [Candidatus Promineifilaceae bacterium]